MHLYNWRLKTWTAIQIRNIKQNDTIQATHNLSDRKYQLKTSYT